MDTKKKPTMKNDQDTFVRHEVTWTPLSSSRIWEFYSSSMAHRKKYFGNRCGHEVAGLLSRKLFPKVNTILDYSCGRGDMLAACIPFLKSRHQIYACDISKNGIEVKTKRLRSPVAMSAKVSRTTNRYLIHLYSLCAYY